jgi:hypothetical protein
MPPRIVRLARTPLAAAAALAVLIVPSSAPAAASWVDAPPALVVLRDAGPGTARAFVDLLDAAGGHVAIVYPPRTAVVYAADEVLAAPEVRAVVAEAHRGAVHVEALAGFGGETARAARAWNVALTLGDLEPEPLPPGFVPFPDAGPRPVSLAKGPVVPRTAVSDNLPFGADYYDTSEFLAGTSAVGVWLLEATGSTYDWTQAEEDQTLAGVQASLDNWVQKGAARAFLTFFLDIHTDVPVSGVPIENAQSMDATWVGEVMTNEGWTGANAFEQCIAYNSAIRDTFDTNWCFSYFIVDSDPTVNQGLFVGGGYAWAYYGGPWVYMSRYSTWAFNSSKYFGVVPMHEMGHIYMATDEYDGVQQFSGYLNLGDTPTTGVNCIMNQNDSVFVCTPSRRQLGWRDGDGDDIMEPLDVEPTVALVPHVPDPTSNPTPMWTGSASVATIPNNNPNSSYFPQHAMTITTIDSVECRVDGGSWTPASLDVDLSDYVEGFTWTSPPLADGTHIVTARARNSVGIWATLLAADTLTVAGSPVGVPGTAAPATLALAPCEPNPVRAEALLRFALPAAGRARLAIVGLDGRRVRTLFDEVRAAGPGAARWDGRDDRGEFVPTGVYLSSLATGSGAASRKLVVIR